MTYTSKIDGTTYHLTQQEDGSWKMEQQMIIGSSIQLVFVGVLSDSEVQQIINSANTKGLYLSALHDFIIRESLKNLGITPAEDSL